ncbi:MAG TPA: hypothetical protein DCQ76_02935 [Ruminococcaceae bacterium]|nr:hypothetical protein [Oscillospiraceae bacterium]
MHFVSAEFFRDSRFVFCRFAPSFKAALRHFSSPRLSGGKRRSFLSVGAKMYAVTTLKTLFNYYTTKTCKIP